MLAFIAPFMVGILCVVLGITNMRGNISTIHSYHRARVAEEDIIPFGRKVGLGTIIIGVGVMVFSALSAVTVYTDNNLFTIIGTAILIASIAVGLAFSFYAMIKYNKGIF